MLRLVPILLIGVASLLAVGCGEDDTLSGDEAASEFERLVAETTGGEAPEVECEDASEENYWDCTGTVAGFPRSFQLHLEGDTIDIVKPEDRVPPAD